jgi:hypothetical protein
MVSILMTLGQAFHVTRVALNHLARRLVFMETDRAVRDLFLELESPPDRQDPKPDETG